MVRSKQECLESLQEARDILGEPPSKTQYRGLELTPVYPTILRKFSSWDKARRKAGLKVLYKGDRNSNDIKPKPDDVELSDGRKWEDMPSGTRFYYRNREAEKKRIREREAEMREWIAVYKHKRGCSRCKENHPAALDFHHTAEHKSKGIASMANDGHSKESIREEIDSCIILCANCHRKEHNSMDS